MAAAAAARVRRVSAAKVVALSLLGCAAALLGAAAHGSAGPAVGAMLLRSGLTLKEMSEGSIWAAPAAEAVRASTAARYACEWRRLGRRLARLDRSRDAGSREASALAALNLDDFELVLPGPDSADDPSPADDPERPSNYTSAFGDDLTLAPTSAIDSWTVYFTATMSSDSLISTSYVWYIQDEDADVLATVLIDSSGLACGVTVLNDTLIYFTDADGGLWTIETTGLESTEILSYTEYGLTGQPSGMDMWIHTNQVFWADLDGYVAGPEKGGLPTRAFRDRIFSRKASILGENPEERWSLVQR